MEKHSETVRLCQHSHSCEADVFLHKNQAWWCRVHVLAKHPGAISKLAPEGGPALGAPALAISKSWTRRLPDLRKRAFPGRGGAGMQSCDRL